MSNNEGSDFRDKLKQHDNDYNSKQKPNRVPPILHKSNTPYEIEDQKKSNKKPNAKIIIKWLIIIVMIGIVGFFAYNLYNNYDDNLTAYYQQGFLEGINYTDYTYRQIILNRSMACQILPVEYPNNLTINLISVGCLTQETNNG